MPAKFKKTKISDEQYESAGAADLNNNGVMDIISGAWWYEGPDFKKKHKVADVLYTGDYYDDFANIMLDINGNGLTDYVTGAFWSDGLRWHENPGDPDKEWPRHHIDECGGIERPCAFDIDGDGTLEIVPNTPGNGVQIYKLKKDKDAKRHRATASVPVTLPVMAAATLCSTTAGSKRPKNRTKKNGYGTRNSSSSGAPALP